MVKIKQRYLLILKSKFSSENFSNKMSSSADCSYCYIGKFDDTLKKKLLETHFKVLARNNKHN